MFNGKRLHDRRKELGLTLDDVGKIVGISRSAVSKYEKEVIKNVYASVVELFAKALKCSPAYLMCWTDDPAEAMERNERLYTKTSDEKELLLSYRVATEEAKKSALMVLKSNRIVKKEQAI